MSAADRRPHLCIALLSLALIALELVWTRVFSAEFFYTFAFLILSLAVMGLGLGGLALRLWPTLAKHSRLGPALLATALLALAGPPLVLRLDLEFGRLFASWAMAGKGLVAVMVLGSAFFTGGMGLALLFRQHHADMPRLYRADLLGAGLGVVGAILAMNGFGVAATTVLIALPLALAAGLLPGRGNRIGALAVALLAVALLPFSTRLVQRPRKDRFPVIHRQWDAMALLKVMETPDGAARVVNLDNAANTTALRFDGQWQAPGREPFEFLVRVKPLIQRMNGSCTFLSLGAGAGQDVLQALQEGAAEVHAVEVNPALNRLMLKGLLADYSGRIYQDPRVRVVTEDARAYVRRNPGRFDLVYSLSSNSFAALANGAFALAENYLFTTEAFEDYWRALSPRGFLVMEHQRYIPRLVSEALEALRRQGVAQPERHLAVYALPKVRRQVILVARQPLEPGLVESALWDLGKENPAEVHQLFPNPHPKGDPQVARIVREGWQKVQASAPIDLSPATDAQPFVAQLGRWQNFSWSGLKKSDAMDWNGFPASKLTVVSVLALVLLIVLPLNLLPFLHRGPRLRARGWAYFFAIGLGFMALEVVLIQRYTLFIGSSAYTVAVILLALLVGSGLGSRWAPRLPDRWPFLAILGWLALELLAFQPLTRALAAQPLALRLALSLLVLMPLGFFLGMPFPKGTARVGELVDWGFAVNGAAGVIGSCTVLLLAFAWGFPAALALAALAYLAALALIRGEGGWVRLPGN